MEITILFLFADYLFGNSKRQKKKRHSLTPQSVNGQFQQKSSTLMALVSKNRKTRSSIFVQNNILKLYIMSIDFFKNL